MRRLTATTAIAAGYLLLTGSPVLAGTELKVSDIRVDAAVRSVDMRVTADRLPAGSGLDPASVVVSVAGRTLPTGSVAVAETSEAEAPRVLIVVDSSGSMAGHPMVEAQQAISAFISQAPADVRLGLMSFATSPKMLVEPTLDRPALLGAVTEIRAQGETSLYDAVVAGVSALGDTGDRRVVVLSDGGDTRSRASLEQALAVTSRSGVSVDAIGFNTGESVQAVLARIAESGRGRVRTAASSAELASALTSAARPQAKVLNLRVLVPEDLRGPQSLLVSAVTDQGPLSATTPVALGRAAAVRAEEADWWGSRGALHTGVAGIGTGVLLVLLTLLSSHKRNTRRTHELLDRFTTTGSKSVSVATAGPVARTALELADRVATKSKLNDKSALRLARAAMALTPAEWLLLQVGASFGLLVIFVLLGWPLLLTVLAGPALGFLVPRAYLSSRGKRRQRSFDEKLPDALQMTAGSLSAGYSLAQAFDGLVQEGSEPIATEMGKALAESRLGVPIETSLEGVAQRMGSTDFGWVVMAIRVQREVGGNLGGVLTTVSATMRERAMMRRHVKGLSAEGRLSAYILIGLPVLLVLYLVTLRRDYLEPLYTTGIGFALIAVAVTLLSLGSFLMSRMVKVEV